MWRVAMIDPPWNETGGGRIKRGADRHYDLIKTPEGIRDAIMESGQWDPAEHAHLFLWYTDNHLLDALKLAELLGFRYVRTLQWIKLRQDRKALRGGIGQYARGAHEGMLFCTRGKGKDPSVYSGRRDLLSAFLAPHPTVGGKRSHSSKPEEAFRLIEARSHGPRVEFFARSAREGWTCWGERGVL